MKQLAGMRGLMAKPSGEIIETPIKANFREGLSVLEYFSSTHGARKGLADTALKTADSGYLTRKLATSPRTWSSTRTTAAQSNGIIEGRVYKGEQGRCQPRREDHRPGGARHDRQPDHRRVIVAENVLITDPIARKIEELGIEKRHGPQPADLREPIGVCARCYGMDLSPGKLVETGMAVGIIAAQSIGEPGTQLTMRTFHTGGVAAHSVRDRDPRPVQRRYRRVPRL
jgi:DNA-directed RNA polymerase subunit beta'